MHELMLIAARQNIVCRAVRGGLLLANASAKVGFFVKTIDEARSLVAHGPRMYHIALASGVETRKVR
jgi:hypothetical protein